MLSLFCAVALAQAAMPKDLAELVKWINADYGKLHDYREEWTMKGDGADVLYKRSLDGGRYRFTVSVDGRPFAESGSDRKVWFNVLYPSKVYSLDTNADDYKSMQENKPEAQTFQFGLTSTGFAINCDPSPKFVSLKPETFKNVPSRHLIAEAFNPETGSRLRMDLIFMLKSWILREVTVTVTKKSAQPEHYLYAIADIHEGVKLLDKEFLFDPAQVSGFRKVSYPELAKEMLGMGAVPPL